MNWFKLNCFLALALACLGVGEPCLAGSHHHPKSACGSEEAAAVELEELKALNLRIEKGELSLDDLRSMGVIQDGEPQAYRQDDTGASMLNQPMSFREILFPKAHTGIYYPKKLSDPSLYSGVQILLPGIGTQISNAKTLFDIANTFLNGTKLGVRGPHKFRLLSIPMDGTLNGLAKGAPFLFATSEGTVAVLRHVHLILRLMHPNLPFFVAGRSQGGLIGMRYAGLYADLAGAVAVNPTEPTMVQAIVDIHEAPGADIFGGIPISFDRSWEAFKSETHTFLPVLHEPTVSQVLLLLGAGDPSYPHPDYLHSLHHFVRHQPSHRRLVDFQIAQANLRHNLWARKQTEIYENTIIAMVHFYQDILQR